MDGVLFKDREEAGKLLAAKLKKYKTGNPLVLALPRGGVVVGYQIAKILALAMDVIIVRKIGSPRDPEFGIGAIAEGGISVLDNRSVKILGISEEQSAEMISREKKELDRRLELYRGGKCLAFAKGKTVIIADDGLATGVTALAAIQAVRKLNPLKMIFAVPVCSFEASDSIGKKVDEFICLSNRENLRAIGLYYRNFSQVSDEEVLQLLSGSSNIKFS